MKYGLLLPCPCWCRLGTGLDVRLQGPRAHALIADDFTRYFATRPDIVVSHNDEPLLIIDTNWKRLKDADVDSKRGVGQPHAAFRDLELKCGAHDLVQPSREIRRVLRNFAVRDPRLIEQQMCRIIQKTIILCAV